MQVVLLLPQELLIDANVVGNREKYCKYSRAAVRFDFLLKS